MSTEPNTDGQANSELINLTRRQALKGVATGAGAATVGVSTSRWAGTPVQRADAIAPLVAGALGLGVGAAAGTMVTGYAANRYFDGQIDEIQDQQIENFIWNRGDAIASQRGERREQIKEMWVNKDSDRTPFADAAWSELRAQSAIEIVNSTGDEQQAATQAVQKQYAIAINNAVQGWNEAIIGSDESDGLVGALTTLLKDGDYEQIQIEYSNTISYGGYTMSAPHPCAFNQEMITEAGGGWEPVEDAGFPAEEWGFPRGAPGSGDTAYPIVKKTVDLPINASQVEDIEHEEVVLYGICCMGTYSSGSTHYFIAAPDGGHVDTTHDSHNENGFDYDTGAILADPQVTINHSEFDTTMPLDGKVYSDYLTSIGDTYSNLTDGGQISEYVDQLNQQLAEGQIEPSDILGPREAIDQFANANDQQRVAAELIFSGMSSPTEDFGFKSKVSHPDLIDDRWGDLFIRFDPGVDTTTDGLSPGQTIPSDEYDLAKFGFYREDTQDYDVFMLSGNEPLTILDVTGTNEEEDATDDAEEEVPSDGTLTIFDGSDMDQEDIPDLLTDPDVTGAVVVEAWDNNEVNTHVFDESEIISPENHVYAVEAPDIANQGVESVRLVPDVGLSQPTQYVSDPGNVNSDEIEQQIQQNRELVESIEGLESPFGGGGGFGSFGLGSVGSRARNAFLAVVGFFGALSLLNATSG